jgi:hypothetical protein
MSPYEDVMNRDSPDGRRIERNPASIWFPLLLQIGGPSLIGVTANDNVRRPRPFCALICKSWTRRLKGSEQDRTKRSKLRQAQCPHMVRLSGATGKRIRALSTACYYCVLLKTT